MAKERPMTIPEWQRSSR